MPTDDMPFEEEEVEETPESEEGLDLDMGMGALTEEPPMEDPMEGPPMEGKKVVMSGVLRTPWVPPSQSTVPMTRPSSSSG